jgi:hypothetical protein
VTELRSLAAYWLLWRARYARLRGRAGHPVLLLRLNWLWSCNTSRCLCPGCRASGLLRRPRPRPSAGSRGRYIANPFDLVHRSGLHS